MVNLYIQSQARVQISLNELYPVHQVMWETVMKKLEFVIGTQDSLLGHMISNMQTCNKRDATDQK